MNRHGVLEGLRYLVVGLVVLFTLVPVVWIFLTAFKPKPEWLSNPPVWIPSEISWKNFSIMWLDGGARAFKNSFIVGVISTVLTMFFGFLAAYSISRFRTGGENFANWILSIRFLPPIAFIVPLTVMYKPLGLLDSYTGLIVTYTAFNLPLAVWVLVGFVDRIPMELDEAALIDGSGRLYMMWRIILPLAAPGIVTTALLVFLFIWGEFALAFVLTQSEMYTIPVRLAQFYSEARGLQWGPQSAMAVVAIIPVMLVALLGQRYVVEALTQGAIKE